MRCDFSREKLLGHFYNEASGDESAEVAAHVASCASCRTELSQLRQTANALRRWPDEEPKLNLHFVQQKSALQNWTSSLRAKAWPKFAVAFAAGAASVLVLLSLLNMEAEYSDGSLHVKFSLFERAPVKPALADPLEQPVTQREFNAWRQSSYELLQSIIEGAATQQRYEQRALLAEFARDLETKRRQDLQRVDQGLEVFQLVNENKFRRTNEVLQHLIYSAYSQTSDTNRIENK
jgi:hypothetical protein